MTKGAIVTCSGCGKIVPLVRGAALKCTCGALTRVSMGQQEDDAADAARIIDELVTALEQIAESTTDEATRALAREALATFEGR